MRRHRRDEDAEVITHVRAARDQVDEGVGVVGLLAEGLRGNHMSRRLLDGVELPRHRTRRGVCSTA